MHSFSYRTRQTLIRTLGCSWRAGAFMLDCRKFGKQWVVTADAMHREFGGWEPWSKYLTDLRKARIAEQGYY